MISSRTIALAILIQIAGIGTAVAQAVEPAVPPPPEEAPPAASATGGSPAPPVIATDPPVVGPVVDVTVPSDPGTVIPGTVMLSASEVDELRAMCSQREDWPTISVCVRLRH
jgi:hypothetical protein